MLKFEATGIACAGCGAAGEPSAVVPRCLRCGHEEFRLQIERSASGFDRGGSEPDFYDRLGELGLLLEFVNDGPGYFRTHSLLEVRNVGGAEIGEFLRSPTEKRRDMYRGWKRREIARGATAAACRRCGVVFQPYANPWNRGGFCSRQCRRVSLKTGS